MTDYRVQLDAYNGPLDLLLYLIRREEVDIFDIPIVRITDQYIAHVDLLKALDPDAAADFLVLAATLMEIKSRMLLPRPPAEEEEEDFEDPRLELVKQLLEYKKFKDAAFSLERLGHDQAHRFQRQPGVLPLEGPEFDLEDAEIWDLFSAFNKLMADVGHTPTAHQVLYDDTPISLYAADIQDRLARENGSLRFDHVFEGRNKVEMIGLFLAMLELIRQKRIRIDRPNAGGLFYLHQLDETPITEASIAAPSEAADFDADEYEAEPAFERGRVASTEPSAAGESDDEDDEMVDDELAAIDADILSMATDLDEQREKLIDTIDRDLDVDAVTRPLTDDSAEADRSDSDAGDRPESAPSPGVQPSNAARSDSTDSKESVESNESAEPAEHPGSKEVGGPEA